MSRIRLGPGEGGVLRIEVRTSDGRILSVEASGDDAGAPVVLLHGTPGSRHGPKPRASVLYRLGVTLVAYDRPGYGGSTRCPGRQVADSVDDVVAIMDALGHETFAVVGRSGGAPHALACAALLPDRVVRAAALVSVAPTHAADLDWFDGMADANVTDFTTADADIATLTKRLEDVAARTRVDPESILHDLQRELTIPDQRAVGNIALRGLLAETYVEALRRGAGGWLDDVLAARSDWGFDLGAINAPVLLWHGALDNLSPVSHTRWLADQIRSAQVHIEPGSGHFGAVAVLPEILSWVAAKDDLVGA